ncbi:uroporphyrinogen-III synthase [Dongia soli]|uniref:Uroporphyrinogen-III synthase n=1 Tax=Dongia soli TaxID=600628 RepID=A0ABU5E7K0_9PROT|nr:uroporphyrinogen-III synthase [Dongia soli]MDY0882268.1 uroporphyrinogen-III synthase [Dongia soli]
MRALITRPQEDAAPLAEALSARGIEPVIESLLEIKPIAGAKIELDGVQAVLFTSANGVRAFANLTDRRDLPAFTVGDGSAATAKELGFTRIESAGGDVKALVSLVCDRLKPQDGALFHAAGSITTGDLAGDLEKAGFTVRRTPLYTAEQAAALSPETRMNLTLGGIDLVLLFSPRTAAIFAALWQEAGSANLEQVCALCLSAAVAREVGDLPWRDVFIAERPDLPSMLALVDAELQRKDEGMSDTATATAEAKRPEPAAGPIPAEDRSPDMNMAASPAAGSGGTAGRLVATVIVAALVSAAVAVTAPRWIGLLGLGQGGAARHDQAVGDLQQSVAQLQQAQANAAAKSDIAAAIGPVQDQLASLKDEVSQLQSGGGASGTDVADLTPLNDKIAGLEKTLGDLQARLPAEPAPNAASQAEAAAPASPPAPDLSPEINALKSENQGLRDQLAALTSRFDALGKVDERVATLESQVAAAPAPVTARQQLGTAVVLSAGQLRSALAGPQPFTAELAALKQLTTADSQLSADVAPIAVKLEPVAASGAPTLSQLQATLPSREIARAAEAEMAADAGGNESWWRRMTHRLSEIVTVRPVGEDVAGDGPLERLARAEAALAAGDLKKTVDELSGLQGEAANRAAGWLGGARARLDLDWAGARLSELASKELAPAQNPAKPAAN